MHSIKDLKWKKDLKASELVDMIGKVGFQGLELGRASEAIVRMKKGGAKIFFSFTSNMVTSGLRGFFAQIIRVGLADVVVTTVGAIEEDIMKAYGEKFLAGSFSADDIELYEKGINRVGNIFVPVESYMRFENAIMPMLAKLYERKKRWTPSELFLEIGLFLKDENSILLQAAKRGVPVFCPAITDGAFGFHLYLFQQKHPDFTVDVVSDFKNILFSTSMDEPKGVIALGGSISKHHAILATLLNGGAEYAVYLTTASQSSGSMSGATTREAKSWGKIRDDADAATVIGDVSITFPLVMSKVLEVLALEGLIIVD
jgi:deoxyhypusine synthase